MELGIYTDSVKHLSFEAALDVAAEIGATGIEIATGGQSSAPHTDLDELLADASARRRFTDAFTSRGLRIAALNCSAWPLHPVVGERHARIIRDTIELASELGVSKIVTMSGNPGDGPGSTAVNFIMYPWPDESVALLDRQWAEAIALWQDLGSYAVAHGVEKLAFELHPLHLVFNVPTVRRMREAVGPVIGANMDPSHLFWQQMDPLAVIADLGEAIYHVHLKDTALIADEVALAGVLDTRPFDDPSRRSWMFRAVGSVRDAYYWSSFIAALRAVGYDDVLSIENEDITLPPEQAVANTAAFMRPLLA